MTKHAKAMARAREERGEWRNPQPVDWRNLRVRWERGRDERQREVLGWLRQAFAEGERPLRGWPEILGYLNALGLRHRHGGFVTEWCGRQWTKRLKMPVLRGRVGTRGRHRSSPPWTTTYILAAWAVNLFSTGGAFMPLVETPAVPVDALRRSKHRAGGMAPPKKVRAA